MSSDDLFSRELFSRERLETARRAARSAGMRALLVTPGPDLRYLTGYHALAMERLTCLVLPAVGEPTLVVPTLERPSAEASPAAGLGLRFVDYADGTDPYPLVAAALSGSTGLTGPSGSIGAEWPGGGAIGVSSQMWAQHVLGLRAVLPGAEQRLAGDVLAGPRARKSAAELAALRRAGQAIDAVHASMGRWLRPGRTEAEVAADIAVAIREAGHVAADFTIVGSGPNGASPHHEVSDRVIEPGDVVVVDIGGTMPDGYRSDCTRTYVLGDTAPAEFLEGYEVLARAQRTAVAAVRPGVSAESIDAVAREAIAEAGYGPLFTHRTGHGIGLETHEDPYVVAGNDTALEPGMVFSVEPGIYWGGRYGARIEDIVACTGDGYERLNTLPTELVHL